MSIQPLLVPGVLLFSIVLLRAPALADEVSPMVLSLTLGPFVLAIASLLLQPGSWHANAWVLLAAAYVGLLVIASARGAFLNTLTQNGAIREITQILLLVTLSLLAFVRESRPRQRERYLRALGWAPVVYVAVNVALHAAGIVASQSGYRCEGCQLEATMLQVLGYSNIRTQFPLSAGVNAFGPICAIALAVSATLAIRGEQRKLAVLATIVSLYAILAIDSRVRCYSECSLWRLSISLPGLASVAWDGSRSPSRSCRSC